MSSMENDAAFGPMGSVTQPPSDAIKEMQTLLNARGYGPLVVDGFFKAEDTQAVVKLMATMGTPWDSTKTAVPLERVMSVLRSKHVLAPGTTTGKMTPPPAPIAPFWKQPKYLAGAVIIGATAWYVAFRTGYFNNKPTAVSGLPPKSHKRKAPPRCERVPADFDAGEAFEPTDEPLNAPES